MLIKITKYPIAFITVFIWIGFVCSISFMEAWLKFYAPNSKLKADQRLTIIPSKHETGTNIRQIPTARVLNTVRKGMSLRDALQRIFRMRQILQGQQVVLGVSKEVKDHIVTLLIQDIMQKDPYRTYLNEFLSSGKKPTWGNTDLDKWLEGAFDQAGEPRSFRAILSAGCASFKLSKHPETLWNYLLKNQIEDKLSKNALSLDHQMKEVVEKPIRIVLFIKRLIYDMFDINKKIVKTA